MISNYDNQNPQPQQIPPQRGLSIERHVHGKDEPKRPQATELVYLANSMAKRLYQDANDSDERTFAAIIVKDHIEHWPINSKAFRNWLQKLYYTEHEKPVRESSLKEAVSTLDAIARFGEKKYPVGLRLARYDDAIYLDLTDDDWRVIRITERGWKVIADDQCPICFIRTAGMLALPEPQRGGSVDELRPLINVPDDDAWRLLVGWILMAFHSNGPYPILAVNGEQGSAKSTLCRYVRNLIDPNQASLRRPPHKEQDMMISAENARIIAYDNLSNIKPDLSDLLCSLATGAGYATRELYTNSEETIFNACRPIMVNGIPDLATRSDLADRTVGLLLPSLRSEYRQGVRSLDEKYEHARPRILGAILDAVSAALRNIDSTNLPTPPRMADFAFWVTAAEESLGWDRGSFMESYEANRSDAHESAVESDPIGPAVLRLMDNHKSGWEGTATELGKELNRLTLNRPGERNRKGWPSTPKGFANAIRRLSPNLLGAYGIEVSSGTTGRGKDKRKTIRLEQRAGAGPQESVGGVASLDRLRPP